MHDIQILNCYDDSDDNNCCYLMFCFFFSIHKGGKPTGFIAGEQKQACGRIFEGWSAAFSKFVYEGFSKICPHSWNVFVPTKRLGL